MPAVAFYKKFSFKIILAFSVLFMLLSMITSRYTYLYFKNVLTDTFTKYLFSRAQTLVNRTELDPPLIALPDSTESIRVFYRDTLQRPIVLFQSPGPIARINTPYHRKTIDTLQQYAVYVSKKDAGGHHIELLFSASSITLHQQLRYLQWLIIAGTMLSALLGSGAVYFLTQWLLQPIRTIIKQAGQIRLTHLNQRVPVSKTHDELQQLTETFNIMLERIAKEQQQQQAFFASASHELKTPLAVLQAQIEYWLGQQMPVETHTLLTDQLAEVKRLQGIVQQFLTTSQLQHGSLILKQSAVDLSEQLLQVFGRNQQQLLQKQLTPALQFDEQHIDYLVQADKDKLEMVWQNLLQNAIKYAPHSSLVSVQVLFKEGRLHVIFNNETLADHIVVSHLGEAFYREDILQNGTGLGLWLCKAIVELHGGHLLIHSQQHQFTVTVYLLPAPFKLI